MPLAKNHKKIGLVLGCGGARGIAHIGVLKILEREEIKPSFIVGSSMGAVIGGAYALGMTANEMEKVALSFNNRSKLGKMFDINLSKGSLIKGNKISDFLKELFGEATFDDTQIPLRITATDLESGEEVIIKKGGVALAAQASSAIPGLFPPVKYEDKYLIDGGIVNPTPIDIAEEMGADVIIAVDLIMHKKIDFEKDPKLINVLLQAYEIVRTQAVVRKLEKVNKDTVIIKPNIRGTMETLKFYDIERFIKAGETATEEMLKEIKKKINL